MYSIAVKKRNENLAEYILYVFQAEDTLRSCNLDVSVLEQGLFENITDESERSATLQWYERLARQMKTERIAQSGHLQELHELMNELLFVQKALLSAKAVQRFTVIYKKVEPLLDELRDKGDRLPRSDVEVALNGLYGILLLRLQRKGLSEATQQASDDLSTYAGFLAAAWKRMHSGDISFFNQ